jgi:glycine/D-amino acid oxidase-like deaminating enzyme
MKQGISGAKAAHDPRDAPAAIAAAMPGLFAPGFVDQPYWHEGVDLSARGQGAALPSAADVVVIGGGYTGLSAAAVTAAAGRSTVVLDAATLGWGCSGLNGGQVSTSIKPGLARLGQRFGNQRAHAIAREGIRALDRLHERARSFDCDWHPVGRFHGAHSPRHYARLAQLARVQRDELGIPCELVPEGEQRREIGSDFYHGGLVYPRHAAVHPARLLLALYGEAIGAGATFHERCPAISIDRQGHGFAVHTAQGTIAARNVLVATNGYTGPFSPWHRRRVIPITSQQVATEPLDPALVQRLLPTRRVITDTRRLVVYFRASPDGTRILFGGRSTLFETRARVFAPLLVQWLRGIFPQLQGARISHAWAGSVAFTFDELPHIGVHEGVHYCMGYCGSGVSLSTWFGTKIGLQLLGRPEGRTALDGIPFQTRPTYTGYPWFLIPSIAAYRLLDRLSL